MSIEELLAKITAENLHPHIEPYWCCEGNGQSYCAKGRLVGLWKYNKDTNVFTVILRSGTRYEFDDFAPVYQTLFEAFKREEF